MSTDTSEKGLENLIVTAMTGRPWPDTGVANTAAQPPAPYGGTGWLNGRAEDYNREWCVDLLQLVAFLRTTQPKLDAALDLGNDTPTRRAFLSRLLNEVGKRGVIDVLLHGIKHGAHEIILFYATPSVGNDKAAELHELNRFSVTRQLRMRSSNWEWFCSSLTQRQGLPITYSTLSINWKPRVSPFHLKQLPCTASQMKWWRGSELMNPA